MSEDAFRIDDDAPDDEPRDDSSLSQHPEAVRARERRDKGYKRKPKKGASTPRRPRVPTSSEITSRLRESLDALANALEDRGDAELSRILKRDGPKMAELLGKWGDHPKTPPPVKVAVVVIAEVLEPLRAFGATARILLRRLRERRLREPEQKEPGEGADEPLYEQRFEGDHGPASLDTPSRFRADVEPPDVN
jgi:hypothetical protein